MLNKLEKRLRSSKMDSISVLDLAKIVELIGVFDMDAIVQDGKRYIVKTVKAETNDSACHIELGCIEYPDKDGKLTKDFTEITVDGVAIEVNDSTAGVVLPVSLAMNTIIDNFLSHKDMYSNIYQKLERLAELQQAMYMAEMSRIEIHDSIMMRMAERGAYD